MATLELTEHRPHPPVALTAMQRDALRALARVRVEPSQGQDGYYDLTPSSWVGVVVTDGLTVHIQPKLAIDRVLFLVSYGLDPRSWRQETTMLRHQAGLVESLIPAFALHVRHAFARGVLQGYRTREEALPVMRGRVRFSDQVRRRYGLFPPVEVRYDAFTEDIDANRLIRAATRRLARLPIRSSKPIQQLASIDAALEHVSVIDYDSQRLPDVPYTRLNAHYRGAVELAKLVLRATGFEAGPGRVGAKAFLVNMNVVFETFVRVALRDALGLSERSFPAGARGRAVRLDHARRIRLEPDLSWWHGDRCVFVGDVKYKRITVAGINHPDLYQLLAYTIATDLPVGMLVYAAGEDEPASHHIAHAGKTLIVTALDLAGEAEDVLDQITALAAKIKDLTTRSGIQAGTR